MAEMTNEEKEKALYMASLPAFFTNEIEIDKIILTLSVGAIGFYSALLTGGNLELTKVMSYAMSISIILFGVTVTMVIGIFSQNKKQLISIISTNGKGEENSHLTFLDKYKYIPFAGAIVCSIIFMLPLVSKNISLSTDIQDQILEKECLKSPERKSSIILLFGNKSTKSKIKQVNNRSRNTLNQEIHNNPYTSKGFIKLKEEHK